MEATEKKFVEKGSDEGCCSNNPVDSPPPVTPKVLGYLLLFFPSNLKD